MHIYPISRLYRKQATSWNRMIDDLEKGREIMLSQYIHLRRAAVAELVKPGSGKAILEQGLAGRATTPSQLAIRRKSLAALKVFRSKFVPLLGELRDNFLDDSYRPGPAKFGKYSIEGRFHFSVELDDGTNKFVYLHTSDWDKDETVSFIELLTVIGEDRHDCGREDVWFIDLQAKQIVPPAKSFKRLRGDLQKVIQLADRIQRAFAPGQTGDDEPLTW